MGQKQVVFDCNREEILTWHRSVTKMKNAKTFVGNVTCECNSIFQTDTTPLKTKKSD